MEEFLTIMWKLGRVTPEQLDKMVTKKNISKARSDAVQQRSKLPEKAVPKRPPKITDVLPG